MEQKPENHTADVVSRKEYEQLQAELNASQGKVAELEQQVTALREALRLAQHKRFGASSEKTVDDGSQQLSFLFNEAEVIADQEAAQDKQETLVAAHKRHKKH
ncbi:MAG: transposase, partial [Aristaeellaceae bacterium]